jgi:hypothetical protein
MSLTRNQQQMLEWLFQLALKNEGYTIFAMSHIFLKSPPSYTAFVESFIGNVKKAIALIDKSFSLLKKEQKKHAIGVTTLRLNDKYVSYINECIVLHKKTYPSTFVTFGIEKAEYASRVENLASYVSQLANYLRLMNLDYLPIRLLEFCASADNTERFWNETQKTFTQSLSVAYDEDKAVDTLRLKLRYKTIEFFLKTGKPTGYLASLKNQFITINKELSFRELDEKKINAFFNENEHYEIRLNTRRPVGLLLRTHYKRRLLTILTIAVIGLIFIDGFYLNVTFIFLLLALLIGLDAAREQHFKKTLSRERDQLSEELSSRTTLTLVQSLLIDLEEGGYSHVPLYLSKDQILSDGGVEETDLPLKDRDKFVEESVVMTSDKSSSTVNTYFPKIKKRHAMIESKTELSPVPSRTIQVNYKNGLEFKGENEYTRILIKRKDHTLITAFFAADNLRQTAKLTKQALDDFQEAFHSRKILGEKEKGTGIKKQPKNRFFYHSILQKHVQSFNKIKPKPTYGYARIFSHRVPAISVVIDGIKCSVKGHYIDCFETFVPGKKAHRK